MNAYRRIDVGHFVLGRRLRNDEDAQHRLANAEALPVFASDALSSVAYATEQMLRVLIPIAGLVAFRAVVPLSGAVVALLAVLVLSYRQTIRAYPNAGGAYVVTRDNFGPNAAQVAGVALLTDYVLTVAVSVTAGMAAITSMAPAVHQWRLPLAVALIWMIAIANMRGLRESARLFAIPAYSFIASVLVLVVAGLLTNPTPQPVTAIPGATVGSLGLIVLLRSFASGCTAMTGVEAISNGVSAFRPDEATNARRVMVWLGGLLGIMFLGISVLASRLHPAISATETMLSQVGRDVFGNHGAGQGAYLWLQVSTAAILVLAANTSFADFPRLLSFQAHDHYMPVGFGRKGRRLVFSDGLIVLATVATVIVVVTGAQLDRLIPLYAIGVFLSFTMSQLGMTRRHLRLREPGWRRGIVINGAGAAVTALVLVVITATKFLAGAWIVFLAIPAMVIRIELANRHYRRVTSTPPIMAVTGPVRWQPQPSSDTGPARPSATDSAGQRWIDRNARPVGSGDKASVEILVGVGDPSDHARSGGAGIEVVVPDGWGRGPQSVMLVLVGSSATVGSAVVRRALELFRCPIRAVHVAVDSDLASEIAAGWPAGLPRLEILDAPTRVAAEPTLALVADLVASGLGVTVAIGHVRTTRVSGRSHNRHGNALRDALIDDGRAAVITISYELASGRKESDEPTH